MGSAGTQQATVGRLVDNKGPKVGALTVATGTAASILDASAPTDIGVKLKANPGNTGIVYIGNGATITADSATTGGYPLSAGQEVELPVCNVNLIYAITTGTQALHWMSM